ncbi:MAG TPA: type I DNA topoisomerase, partial [Barnesiella intestinihominis]|nr:type I DNA topoisomerase [Barnesiella intestinihominis]
ASDEDREGEAIAWHLFEVLKLKPEKTKRIVFHEITKDAILHAIENPRDIDLNRVDAQQARRVLDRIVGFELSPVLWKKVKPALSAGRVQSVAVRLIVEREREISAFKPEAAYRVIGEFLLPGGELLKAELSQRLKTEDEAKALLEACKTAQFSIGDVTVKPAKKSPAAPFTTSTLQQEAARKLGFSVAQTMMVAQRLYEAGHITYMRTDSVNLSSLAINTTKDEIVKTLGERYLHIRNYHTHTKGAQEAHEAIRPTYISHHEINASSQEKRLYELIWKRTIASQMSDAELEKTTATIAVSGRKEHFVAVGEVLKFDGFLKVYMESTDDESDAEGNDKMLPALAKGDVLTLSSVTATERFSQAPARYTEASLVRKLEELGIGRPSTYAPTISTIQQREYVEKGDRKGTERKYRMLTLHDGKIESGEKTELTGADKGKLLPTDIGVVVNDFLTEYFPDILNYNFTANVEQQFDDIAEGKTVWNDEIDHFYKLFHPVVESALALRLEHKVGERVLGTDPKSGRPVSVKIGRFGPLVQIGTPEDTEKPLFASLLKGQSMSTITLEEALKLFDLPRTLGDFEGKTVVVGIGRFGPYIRHDGKYVSLPKEFTPQGVSLEDAIILIQQKREQESQRLIKKFDEDDELELLNGRFGPYIAYKKKNYKLPKGSEPASLTFADCMKIVEDADKAPAKKKPARKKTTK